MERGTCKDSGGPLLDDRSLELRVRLVGELPPILKVPGDVLVLPPPRWKGAILPRKDALVAVRLRRCVDEMHAAPDIGIIRVTLPAPPADDLELLMLELSLAPLKKRGAAERQLRVALRRAGGAMGVAVPPVIRQLQLVDGGLRALVAVSGQFAMRWLRASGCGRLFFRPFFTASTAAELDRNRFALLWGKGADPAKAAILWDAVHDLPGVVGLVRAAKDIAIRETAKAVMQHLEAQLRVVCGQLEARLHKPKTCVRLWCVQRLVEQELWQVDTPLHSLE